MYTQLDSKFEKLHVLGEGSSGKVYLCTLKQEASKQQSENNENLNQVMNNLSLNQGPSQNSTNGLSQNQKQGITQAKSYFALKRLKILPVPISSKNPYEQTNDKPLNVLQLRQVQVMKSLSHENLIQFNEIVEKDKGYIIDHYLVLPFGIEILQFAKQKQLQLTKPHFQYMVSQIITGLAYMHSEGFMHRDVKPDNIFLMKDGTVKLGDFSLSRKFNSVQNLQQATQEKQQESKMSGNVVTRYYRAPEIVYGSRQYSDKIDIWALGCTLAELILHQPLFPGQTDINLLELIFTTLGYPQDSWPEAAQLPFYLEFDNSTKPKGLKNILPDVDEDLLSLIQNCLQLDPKKRPNAQQLLKHEYFAKQLGVNNNSNNEEDQTEESLRKGFSKVAQYLNQKKLKKVLGSKKSDTK